MTQPTTDEQNQMMKTLAKLEGGPLLLIGGLCFVSGLVALSAETKAAKAAAAPKAPVAPLPKPAVSPPVTRNDLMSALAALAPCTTRGCRLDPNHKYRCWTGGVVSNSTS